MLLIKTIFNYFSEQDINYLLKLALEKVAVLPYAFAVDHWRWNVFRGLILPSDYNKEWWNNRLDISCVSNWMYHWMYMCCWVWCIIRCVLNLIYHWMCCEFNIYLNALWIWGIIGCVVNFWCIIWCFERFEVSFYFFERFNVSLDVLKGLIYISFLSNY